MFSCVYSNENLKDNKESESKRAYVGKGRNPGDVIQGDAISDIIRESSLNLRWKDLVHSEKRTVDVSKGDPGDVQRRVNYSCGGFRPSKP